MFPQHFLKTQEFCFLASNLQPPLLGFVCLTWKALGWTSEENSKGKNLQRAPCVRVDQHLLGLARLNIFVSRHHRQWKGRPDPQTHPNPKERYQHLGVVGRLNWSKFNIKSSIFHHNLTWVLWNPASLVHILPCLCWGLRTPFVCSPGFGRSDDFGYCILIPWCHKEKKTSQKSSHLEEFWCLTFKQRTDHI